MSEWTDEVGRPLGEWVVIDEAERRDLFYAAGGFDALTVFSSLTDPEGVYGRPQVYTAWGFRDKNYPLLDVRDYVAPGENERICRKFVPAQQPPERGER